MLLLHCPVQRYAWGKRGLDSMVARVKLAGDSTFQVEDGESYAEYWAGTHPSGQAKIVTTGETLSAWLRRYPTAVGAVAEGYPSDNLVFLLKILSIRTALSIQAHPDRLLAAHLFVKDPLNYKDPNHKPEMVIALTNFEAMCGFRPVSEIKRHLVSYPELAELASPEVVSRFYDPLLDDSTSEEDKHSLLKSLFVNFMKSPTDVVESAVNRLITRITSSNSSFVEASDPAFTQVSDLTDIDGLMVRLNADFPGDIGVMCPLLLNCVKLRPGQSFFMGPSEPHAYVSGDCIECMAPSDNVIRSGLTPKFKDVDVLCQMLSYRNGKLKTEVKPIQIDEYTLIYRPPFDLAAEFEVEKCELPPSTDYIFPLLHCCAIILVVQGECDVCEISSGMENCPEEILREIPCAKGGSTIFLTAFGKYSIRSGSGGVIIYRAHINTGNL